jgi:hypothetical protein
MQSMTIKIDDRIGRLIKHRSRGRSQSPQDTVVELMTLGFEAFLSENYNRYRRGEVSFGRLAEELGVTTWELSHLLEERGWPISNLPSPP